MDWLSFIQNAAMIVGAIKTVSVATPNKSDNKVLDTIFKTVNLLALNIGRDKNAN